MIAVQFRRKRSQATDYRKRFKLLSSGVDRLVVRKTLSKLMVQIVEFGQKGDIIKMGVDSTELLKHGWKGSVKNVPAAYLTGYMLAKKAVKNKIHEAVLDIGRKTSVKSSNIYGAAAGARDAGLKIPVGDVLPQKERIEGKHIASYAAMLKKDRKKYEKNFSEYIKNNLDPEKLPDHFNEVKDKITNDFKDLPKAEIQQEDEGEEWEDVK